MCMSLESAQLLPEQLKQKLPDFMLKIQMLSEKLNLDLTQFQADHIALRINDNELAEKAHNAWLEHGEQISNAQINGRPIIVLVFKQPLTALDWQIECLELPYPAPGKIYPEQSWEHVEFVVPSQAHTAEQFAEEIKQRFPQLAEQWDDLTEQGIKVKLSSPKGEGERLNNPTVAFKYQGVCIKLHPHSLKAIVESEQSA
ncbi:VOC family protein [Vibrio sp. 404]|uniref:VOC family protein n=1 Tax=Vibrio marinisediminis TaxID=2758441 RepID=A0A7W2FQH4_9VIBR|nr:VOC family protein [Vibrio marinisediminis]